ncbi:DUF6624 domain-containing protein [Phenylobacterium sp.]|uniref:DUF6624 domain-containing protein n=1 Tax=Phenylobacterium sp. TaxID=1871053 RepID=UPI0025F3FE1F|nr:DUF6624 domain-containing protein [Phenylobacterium sp.]MBX3484218.1 hypothetical protein [Phenylobacterium sp.]MCW5760648.1 hypothetical protein [Phenylobacterium sp.]
MARRIDIPFGIWVCVLTLAFGLAHAQTARAQATPAGKAALVAIEQVRAKQQIVSELAGMGAVDRLMRDRFLALRRTATDAERADLDDVWREHYRPIDQQHTARLKALLGDGPWFRRSEVGPRAEAAADLIVSHSNDDTFQKLVLSKMQPLVGAETPRGYATLFDRVAVQEGRPQRFGTQRPTCEGERHARPEDIEDPESLDKRRREIGLPPMTEYLAELDKIYGACTPPPPRGGE